MSFYACNSRGECETTEKGRVVSLDSAACQSTCRPLEGDKQATEIFYLTLEYDLPKALEAAPSDQVQVIRRVTGVTVGSYHSYTILESIIEQNYVALYLYQGWNGKCPFRAYLEKQGLTDFDFFLLAFYPISNEIRWYNSTMNIPLNWFALSGRLRRNFQDILLRRGSDFVEDTLELENLPVNEQMDELRSIMAVTWGYTLQGTPYTRTFSAELQQHVFDMEEFQPRASTYLVDNWDLVESLLQEL